MEGTGPRELLTAQCAGVCFRPCHAVSTTGKQEPRTSEEVEKGQGSTGERERIRQPSKRP